ncbi:MAG: hypothetical protein IT275_11755 [Chitinophagales bacterium]|nr:hypothetical protein [Chitinophagales bacterium]
MKKSTLILAVLISIFSVSCKKDKLSIDYSKIKVKQIATNNNGSSMDTIRFFYTNDNVKTVTNYSANPTFLYTWNYIKNGNKYDVSSIYGTVNTHEGFYNINSQGFIDTSRFTNIVTSAFNNRDKYYYNSDGYNTRSITNYNTYENDVTKYYTVEGDFKYWIYDFKHFTTPASSYIDSIAFDYYNDENHVAFEYSLQDKFGKLNKHLVKKRYNYDRTTGILKRTIEYQYELDSKGLVTRRISSYYNQPGNILSSTVDSRYTYYE